MQVIFLFGPAACGKYTIAQKLSEKIALPLFHNHLTVDLVMSLFEFGSEGFKNLRSQVWKSSFREAAKAKQSFIFTFHPEASVEANLIRDLTSLIEEHDGSIFFVELTCPTDIILERLSSDSRKQFGKLTDPELYKTIEAQGGFDYTGMPEPDYVINTGETSAEDAVTLITREWDKVK